MASRSAPAARPSKLKQRLREISDLNAAGSVLNWDEATYMPQTGAGARGRQLAMLCRVGGVVTGNAVPPLSFFGRCMVLERISGLAGSRRPEGHPSLSR